MAIDNGLQDHPDYIDYQDKLNEISVSYIIIQ